MTHRKRPYSFTIAVAIALLLVLAAPSAAGAHAEQVDLLVTLHDANGAPVTGASIDIRRAAGSTIEAHALTGANGQALLAKIAAGRVRVMVSGALPDGTHLVQPGQDAEGVTLVLTSPRTRLDLRVDPHGLVLPDPATMIDPVPNGPAIATRPTTRESHTPRPAGGVVAPSSPRVSPTTPSGAATVAAPAPPASSAWLGWGLLGVLGLSVVGVLASLRGRQP